MDGAEGGSGVSTTDAETTTVLCAGGCRSVRELLTLAIGLEPGLECIGGVADLREAADALDRTAARVVVVVHDRSDPDGLEDIRPLKRRWPGLRVLVIARQPTIDLLLRAAVLEADGFLAKDSALPDIMAALRDPALRIELDDVTMRALRQDILEWGELGGRQWHHGMTEREREVLALLARGMDIPTIARHLRLSVHTARGYVRNVLGKLGAHSQLDAVLIALRSGIVRWEVVVEGPAAECQLHRRPA